MSLPDPMPRVTPAEAAAIALSLCLGQRIGAASGTVRLVMMAIDKAGWDHVAKEDRSNNVLEFKANNK